MDTLLSLETTGKICSVAIHKQDSVLFYSEYCVENSHAEVLNLLVDQALNVTGIASNQLSAIAVSIGPGSYTGLRIGLSSAKGLSFAWDIPLITINTLEAMAAHVSNLGYNESIIVPMLDARRMEVFMAGYDSLLNQTIAPSSFIFTEESINNSFSEYSGLIFCGDGMPKGKSLLTNLKGANFLDNIYPRADSVGNLALTKLHLSEFADLAYQEPFYLKPFYSTSHNSN